MSRLHARKGYGQSPIRTRTVGVEWPVPTHRQRRSSGVGTTRGESMSNHLRTGVVLQFAARKRAHGSGLGLNELRQPESFRRESLSSEGRLHAICDSGRERVRPLADCLRGDADFSGGSRGATTEQLDGGCLVHGSLKHSFREEAIMLYASESTLRPMDSFGKRLAHALKERNAERKALAAVLGVSTQAVSQIINSATSAMTATNTAKAARYLQVSWYWLATGEGDMENVEYPVAKQEALALANLRTINTLDPNAAQRITNDLGRIADGLRAQEALSPNRSSLPAPISNDRPNDGSLVNEDAAKRNSA